MRRILDTALYTHRMRRTALTALVLLGLGGCLFRKAPRAVPEPTPAPVATVTSVTAAPTIAPTAPPAPTATSTPVPPPPTVPPPAAPTARPTPPSPRPTATAVPSSPTPAPPAATGSVAGRIEVVGADGKAQPAADAVLWIPGGPPSPAPARPTITSRDKRFEPHVLAVPKGTAVSFPNVDKIFHNAFSLTPGSTFDLGLYRSGASKDVVLEKPGLVRVYCNIHPKMAAYVMVLDRGTFTVSAADGSFRLPGLPPGKWTLKVWHERGGETELKVDVAAGRETRVAPTLDASGYKDVPHTNKRGEAYPKSSRGDERY